MTTRILHLSDLHFGSMHHFAQDDNDRTRTSMVQAVLDALADAKMSAIDGVVLSGDFFSTHQAKERALAQDQLGLLLRELGVDASQVAIVPGNHDMTWDVEFKSSRFRFYDELVAGIGCSGMKRDAFPVVHSLAGANGPRLELLLLDSCRFGDPKMEKFGRVGEKQLSDLRTKLRAANESTAGSVRVAVLHHHLFPVWDLEQIWDVEAPEEGPVRTISVTVDAPNIVRELAALNVSLVLHGHQHRPFVVRHEDYFGEPYSLLVVGAGASGAKPGEGESFLRQFFVHELSVDSLRCHSFRQSSAQAYKFVPDGEASHEIALAGPIRDGQHCVRDEKVQGLREAISSVDINRNPDRSDLFYFFISVPHCADARGKIRMIAAELDREISPKGSNRQIEIVGMYDLMGHWDLLVQFRCTSLDHAELFHSRLEKDLHLVPKKGDRENYLNRHFPLPEWVNVRQEVRSLRQRAGTELSPPPSRTRLGTNDEYERQRCQRALLYIPCHTSEELDAVCDRLEGPLRAFEGTAGIVELYSLGEKALVIELFLTCRKMVDLNRLSRAIDEALNGWPVQKFTLFCYWHEENVSRSPLAVVEAQIPTPV